MGGSAYLQHGIGGDCERRRKTETKDREVPTEKGREDIQERLQGNVFKEIARVQNDPRPASPDISGQLVII